MGSDIIIGENKEIMKIVPGLTSSVSESDTKRKWGHFRVMSVML